MSQTTDASDASTDVPIPALLPRDWPRQLADRVGATAFERQPLVLRRLTELVDAWVLAATSDDA